MPLRIIRDRWFVRSLLILAILALSLGAWIVWSIRGNATQEVARLADLCELQPGMTVGEVGAGNGKMTVAMARFLGPEGKVYSSDLNTKRVDDIEAAAASANLQNVNVLKGQPAETGFPPDCCNAVFMSKVYHHFTDPATMNRSLGKSLQPGARLAIIDFEPAGWHRWLDRPKDVPANRRGHGIPRPLLISELKQAGFEIEHEIPHWWGGPFGRYCVIARKPLD